MPIQNIAARARGALRRSGRGPTHIRIEGSSFCQLRCPCCPTTTGHIHPAVGSGFLSAANFRDLIDRTTTLDRIELSNYGETLLNPELPEMLEYARRRRVAITLENGVNLNHARPELLEALVKYQVRLITCSIDGATPETYRTYRVHGDLDTVLAHIRTINGWKRHYRSEQPQLVWQFVIFGHNEHEIDLARATAADLGMTFRVKLTWDDRLSPLRDPERVRRAIGETAVTRDEYEALHGHKYAAGICHQLWDDPQINWDGRVLGCCRNFWGDFGGNAFSDGLVASLSNEKIEYARAMLQGTSPARQDIPCSTCDLYHAMQQRGLFIQRPTR